MGPSPSERSVAPQGDEGRVEQSGAKPQRPNRLEVALIASLCDANASAAGLGLQPEVAVDARTRANTDVDPHRRWSANGPRRWHTRGHLLDWRGLAGRIYETGASRIHGTMTQRSSTEAKNEASLARNGTCVPSSRIELKCT
jgi:hypothetical protein